MIMKRKLLLALISFAVSSTFLCGCDTIVDALVLKGPKGDTGEKGLNGNDGKDGKDGVDGKDGKDGVDGINGKDGVDGTDGKDGVDGKDGSKLLTGQADPTNDIGEVDDVYINVATWNYYLKTIEGWELVGNIKGKDGDNGVDGVSIVSSYINASGDLIITLSTGEEINAGNVLITEEFTVNFYCDDLLVDTQLVKSGNKVHAPILEDFVVDHWFIDEKFEHEWLCYGCVVTEDLNLYGKYIPVDRTISFDEEHFNQVDEFGFEALIKDDKEICVSKALTTDAYLAVLDERGILFNKSEIGVIHSLKIEIEEEAFSSAKLYFGSSPLSIKHEINLTAGLNIIDLNYSEYFTIQNTSDSELKIESLDIVYGKKAKLSDDLLPSVIIETKNGKSVDSRLEYVDCNVTTSGAEKDVSGLKAKIKIRGNSTAYCPKKPYRIKLDKKNSLFGYTKAKNWVLLADYMDASNMHNYSALKFAKMVRGEESFGVNPLHVNVILNGENIGLYEFGEHIDAKEGRLDFEQDNLWEKSFDEINFYVERDLSTVDDDSEIEGETYFKVEMENYSPSTYIFALKYPEKEDFEEELENGETDPHEEEFFNFFNSLKEYFTDICGKFVNYSLDSEEFSSIQSAVDVKSLAEYSVIDQAFAESDHGQKSFKMYRTYGGLLKFGPNWDYDSCAYGLPYQGTYVLNPFSVGSTSFTSIYFSEKWGRTLFNDITNGRPLFKEVWDTISVLEICDFIDSQYSELSRISISTVYDCSRWMNNQFHSVFDNIIYYWKWMNTQLHYLKTYYS